MITFPPGVRLVLASASPRRADLLRSVGLEFEVRPSDLDETIHDGEAPADYVRRLSLEKAAVAIVDPALVPASVAGSEVIVAADTTVELDGQVLGKPADVDDARTMLHALSGRAHRVHTGVTVAGGATSSTALVTSTVEFAALDDATVEWYLGTGEPFGKAGAYAIQGAGGALVGRVDGSVTNVIGLPLTETLELIRAAVGPS